MDVPEQKKQTKSAEELAAMIVEDLSKVDGCPERGVNVTVYGLPRSEERRVGKECRP